MSASAERLAAECPQTYEAGPADSWYRIADAAGITPSALLNENGATVDTVILPGDDICLPAGGTVPTQPTVTTAAPDTTAAPATTEAPSPTTTEAPSTTSPTSGVKRIQKRPVSVRPLRSNNGALAPSIGRLTSPVSPSYHCTVAA